MDIREIKRNGKMVATIFDINRNILRQFPVDKIKDPVSGDMMLDFDAAFMEGDKVTGAYGICCNYQLGNYCLSSDYTMFY